jgi:hypothetical protein
LINSIIFKSRGCSAQTQVRSPKEKTMADKKKGKKDKQDKKDKKEKKTKKEK